METLQRDNRPREIECAYAWHFSLFPLTVLFAFAVISVDKSYKPKVSTWGVFPRPDNISEAFGGGRNLTPGAPLEPDSASSARLARVRAVVGNYKLAAGLEVDPSDEAFVAEELRAGEALLSAGRLEAAAASFRSAADRAPLMSGEGGTARLRLALCLDSSGDSEGAKVLYTALGRHPDAEVKKQASRLLWGSASREGGAWKRLDRSCSTIARHCLIAPLPPAVTEATAFMKADAFDYMAGSARHSMAGVHCCQCSRFTRPPPPFAVREEYETYLMKPVMLEGLVSGGAGDAEELAAVNRATAAAALALVALPVGLLLAVRAAAMHARASAHG